MFKIPTRLRDSYLGSFLMGASFTLAFCPTMFVLFILTLMPVVLETSYGFVLPSVFGIGTSLPLLLIIFLYLVFWGKWDYIKEKQKNRFTRSETCRGYYSCYWYSGYFNLLVKEVGYV